MCSLKFGVSARTVTNVVNVNVVKSVHELEKEVAVLREKLQHHPMEANFVNSQQESELLRHELNGTR